ncbi:MAG: polysaccharide deacetylase family protein [Acidobacteriota bacterium]|nr:polysaccharide deacetylase family protein [Acidobacteriota bacterium]
MIAALRRLFAGKAAAHPPSAAATDPPAASAPVANLFRHYSSLCEAAGVDKVYLVLTFDCDTDQDIAAARDLDVDLRRRGIRAGYAVPGVQLERGASTWREIRQGGAEFLNHGSQAHAEYRDDRYWPVTFYNEMSESAVLADVRRGHQTLLDVFESGPEGFRAPHFGSFQAPEQLELLYDCLRPLEYRYCSTTIPALGLSRGPVVDMRGLAELPTTGSYRYPTTLLDSWTYLTDRCDYQLSEEYFELFEETIRLLTEERLPAILTYYADPAHVLGQKPFERALDAIGAFGVPSLQGREVIQRFRPR